MRQGAASLEALAADLAEREGDPVGRPRIAHLHRLPARPARTAPLPDDLPAALADRLRALGVASLYRHQATARALLAEGRHVVVATGTASGKSLCYQLPLLEQALADDRSTTLYLAPTKALARDQLRALRALGLPQVRAAAYDGDTERAEREAIRRTANVVLTNPDMLHAGILPNHRRWADFLHRLGLVIVDECHVARGIFGAHVAAVLRRLRRLAAFYAAAPTFVLASATIANPAEHAAALSGLEVTAVTEDASPRPPMTIALWEPPITDPDAGTRRSALAEGADVLAGLAAQGPQTLAFVRSRKAAEVVAAVTRERLGDPAAVRAYRAGLRGEERRAVEAGLTDGTLRAVAATDALELGVDVGSLDAVVLLGWPGTVASLWQRAGRAGRRGREATVVFVADDDPLDHYLLAHPDELLGRPLEAATVDVTNPYVAAPHLRCAAAELPIEDGEEVLGAGDAALLDAEEAAGRLRRRGPRRYHAGRGSPARDVALRTAGGEPVAIVEEATGALVGEVDEARAPRTVHPGAIYLHQGETYEVSSLDLERGVALVARTTAPITTTPRTDTDIAVVAEEDRVAWGRCRLAVGRIEVASQVLGYERRRLPSGESLGVVDLDLPRRLLDTRAVWIAIGEEVLEAAGLAPHEVAGAAHAAEHAAIGLLPLVAMCDRGDIGGLSTPWHPDTAAATIFIYDGHPGGAGVAERAFAAAVRHLSATRDAIAACPCATGCPSCVQSPKCGNGNEPLDKAGAVALLSAVLAEGGHR